MQVAFKKCLEGNYRERAEGMTRFFARDVCFQHLWFKAHSRDDAWGIYQVSSALRDQHALCHSSAAGINMHGVRLRGTACGAVQLWSFNNLGIDCDFLDICERPPWHVMVRAQHIDMSPAPPPIHSASACERRSHCLIT